MATDRSRSADARHPRAVAHAVVLRTLDGGAYADRALFAEARGLAGRDRSLAKRLAYGTVQRRASLDWLIDSHVERALDPTIRAALQLGLYQLLFTEIADHAAIGETVELVKSHKGHTLVNAVLRKVQREGVQWPGDATPEAAAITHSHPLWLVRMWWEWLGAEETRLLLAANNEPAEQALRVNPLVGIDVTLAGRRDGDVLILDGPIDLFEHELYRAGAITPQSRASQLVSQWVDPQPGERILDLCAAPGGKTTHLAALGGDRAEVVALELQPKRAAAIERQAQRLRATSVRVVVGDATDLGAVASELGGPFDRVLLDPPCSGLGTLQRHPDVRWRVTEEDVTRLGALQQQMAEQARGVLKPGGRFVYSVCTLSAPEELPCQQSTRTMPHRDGTDGFYIGRDDG
ncbi:MAG: transcription antitermination factor NusB [Baekduia sp.]